MKLEKLNNERNSNRIRRPTRVSVGAGGRFQYFLQLFLFQSQFMVHVSGLVFGDIFSHIGDIQTLLVIQAGKQATCSLTGPCIRLGVRGIRPGRVVIQSSTQ